MVRYEARKAQTTSFGLRLRTYAAKAAVFSVHVRNAFRIFNGGFDYFHMCPPANQ